MDTRPHFCLPAPSISPDTLGITFLQRHWSDVALCLNGNGQERQVATVAKPWAGWRLPGAISLEGDMQSDPKTDPVRHHKPKVKCLSKVML